jgi:hypothetical protein
MSCQLTLRAQDLSVGERPGGRTVNPEEIKDIVTAIAIVLGVAGAAWKWFFEEWLRRRSDIPSLSGEIAVKAVPFSANRALLQIDSEWTNNGNFPAYIDPETLEVSIFSIRPDIQVGFLKSGRPPGPKVAKILPKKKWLGYFFEPKTKSTVQTVAVVESGRSYLVQLSFALDEKRHGSIGDYLWTYERSIVVDVPLAQ